MVRHDGRVDGEIGNSSVRVEIDDAAGGGGAPLPDAPGGGRSRLPLLGGLLALIVALGLVAVALPDRDDPLPGGPELAADATTTSTTTTEAPTTTIQPETGLQRTDLRGQVMSVVPAERGWIALQALTTRMGPPQLHRSLDGVEWAPIETVDTTEPTENAVLDYSNLTTTAEGFALLRTATTNPGPSAENSTVRVDRLVSEFGVEWVVDPTFEPIEQIGVFLQPIAHVGEWVHVVSWSDQVLGLNSLFGNVLQENVADPDLLPESICWAFESGSRIEIISCADGPTVSIEAEDLLVPEDFAQVRQCVNVLVGSIGQLMTGFEFATFGPAGSERTINDVARIIAAPSVLDDGTVVLVDAGTDLLDTGVCGDLVEAQDAIGAAIVVWPPDAVEPVRVPIEFDRLPAQVFGPTRAAEATENGIRILLGSDVWDVAVDLSSAELVYDAGERQPDDAALLADGGDSIVRRVGTIIELVDVDTGEQVVLDDGVDPTAWIEPLALFDDHLFVTENGNLSVLDLTSP
jgi:hypothetical protein